MQHDFYKMRSFKHLLLFLLCSICLTSLFAQTQYLDSLQKELHTTTDDSTRLERLISICKAYNNYQPNRGFPYANEALQIAKKRKHAEKEAEVQKVWGRLAANNGQLDTALLHFQLARQLTPQFESGKFLIDLMLKFKFIHSAQGNNDSAMYYSFKALSLAEEQNDSIGIANSLNEITEIMATMGPAREALKYAERALEMNQILGRVPKLALTYQNLGVIYREMGDFDKALHFQNKSLDVFHQIGDQTEFAIGLLYRGNIYKFQEDYVSALEDYQRGAVLAKEIGYPGLTHVLNASVGDIYVRTEQYEKALPFLLESVREMNESEMSNNLPENYRHIAKAYAQLQQHDSAYHFLDLSYNVRDTIYSKESRETSSRLRTEYETQKNLDEIALLRKDKERQQLIIVFSIGFLGLMAIILFLFGRSNRIRKESNRLLSQTNDTLNSQNAEIENQRDLIAIQNNKNELLLKEIHHRVKNNLQTISSLLNLQSAYIKDADVKKAVQAGQHRVKSMALIHQKLYQRENLAAIEMKDYLSTLGESLMDTFGEKAENVQLILNMDEIELDVDTAVPVGLIVNELLTNSLKYAFPDGKAGTISMDLHKTAEQKWELSVMDDGVGKSDDQDTKESTSFGSRLIHLLSLQLNGKMVIDHSQGTKVSLLFEEIR